MNNVTRILIVENLTSDYELVQREIGKVIKQCRFERVENQREFLKSLQGYQPDLILSNSALPGFDGKRVLKLVQKHSLSVPVIIWTVPLGDRVAVEYLNKGAADYVLKSDIKRLGPAVTRALARRSLQIENKRAEEMYHSLFENSMEGIFQSTPDGRFLRVNPAMARIYGYSSPAEMIETITDIPSQVYADSGSRSRFVELLQKDGRITNFEMTNLRKDGSLFWTSTSARTVRDENENILYYEGFLQDITASKQAEERLVKNENRFRALIENALDNIALLGADGSLLWENPPVNSSLDYTPGEFLGTNIFRLLHPGDLAWISGLFADLIREPGKVQRATFRLRHLDGTWRWNEGTATNMLDDPSVQAIVVNYRDVTERRQAEESLRESEERYRLLFDSNPLPMWIYDLQTLAFLRVNDAAVQHYGYSLDEFMKMTIRDIRPPEDIPMLVENVANITPGINQAGIWRHCKKDGTVILVEIVSCPVEFEGRRSELVLSIDITERVQAEEALRVSQAKYQNLVETSHDLIWSIDPDGRFTYINHAAREIYGYEPFELIGRPFFEFFDPEYPFLDLKEFHQLINQSDELTEMEIAVRSRDDRQIILSTNAMVLRDESGRVTGVTGSSRDITLRKHVEDILTEERNLLRTLIDHLPDRIYAMDEEGRKTLSNTADWLASGKKTMEDVIGRTDFELYPLELAEQYGQLNREVLESGQVVINHEEPGVDPEGNPVSILTSKIPLRDGSGRVTGLVGVGRDITDRKQAEARVKDLLEFNEKILNHSPLGILTYKLTGDCVFANENAASILGAGVEELKSQNFHRIEAWKASGLYDLVSRTIATRSAVTGDIHLTTSFGRDVWLTAHFVLFKSKDEDHLLVTISDITDRKLAEDKLRDSENRLVMALSAAQISVWEWDLATNAVLWSPELYAVTGITETAFDGTFDGYTDLIHPLDTVRVREAAERALAENTMFAEEFRIIRPGGDIRWLSNLGHAEYGEAGTSLRMIGTVQDITRRKQVEIERQALLEIMQGLAQTDDLQEFLRLIHRSIANVIYAENFFVVFHNRDTGFFEEIYCVDQYDPPAPPSRLEKSITSYVFRTGEPLLVSHEDFEELVAQGKVELVGTNSASWLGAPLKALNETIGVMVVQDYENPGRYSENDKNFLASIANQVALALARKQVEEKMRESGQRYQALFEDSPVSIWEEDLSRVKKHLDSLKEQGVRDFRAYFDSHPEAVAECARMVGVLDVNNAGLQMYHAGSKEELIESTIQNLCQGEQDHNHEDFIAIAEGRTSNSWEGGDETMTGEPLEISLKWSVAPGHEHDYSQVFVTVIDITERKRAEEEIGRRVKETSALLETSLALTSLDLKAILHDVGNSAKTLFAADGCRIFLMQPDGESLRCVLALQENLTAFSHLVIGLDQGVTGAVAASGQAEIVNDMRNDRRAVQVPGTAEEDEAIMFAPLRERDRTIGVLSVRRVGSDRPFQPADLAFLEAFASMAASAVSNARLFDETQRRLSELEALHENGLAVGQLMEPRQIGARIIETFARHLSWHHVAIRLLKPGTDILELIAFNEPGLTMEDRPATEQRFNSMIHKVGQGLSGWAVKTGRPVRTGNVLEYPQYVSTSPGIKSGLYMPLQAGESVIGVICVESEEPDALTAQDERLLATFANQAAIAFENARLYQAAQQEIQERRLIELELRESQERYRLLIETSPDGIIMANRDGTIRFSNLQMAGLFHLEAPDELLGTNIISLFAPEEQARMRQRMGRYILEDVSQAGHWLMRKDGSRFFAELRSSALRNEKDEQYAIIAQLRDVTERKQAQEALQEERQRFLDLFENSPNPTWLEDFTAVIAWMEELRSQGVKDLQEYLEANLDEYRIGLSLVRVLNVNQAAVISNGARDKQELIDKLPELLFDKTPSHILIHELNMIWQGQASFGFEMSSPRLDGSLTTGILRIYIPSNYGRPDYARVIVTSTDITDRVEIERKLRASELHYRELADSITDVLFELDHDLQFTHWNKASEMLMGIPAHEAIGRSMYEVFGKSQEQERIGRIYRSVLEENQARTFETEIILQGQKLVFEINANPSMRGVSVVARNITERKLSETLMQKRFELMEYSARHSFEEVLQKTIDVVSELTESHIGFLHFMEANQSAIMLQAWSTETSWDLCKAEGEGMHYPVDQAGVWAEAVRQRRSVIHNDYASLLGRKGVPDGHAKVVREMLIPVQRNEKIVAVLGVGNKSEEYTQQDIEIAERFADYAWDITERKQMESALAEERNRLAKRVEERTADLSRANANLARALRVKDEFLANMSHELRTPLNAILGLSESLGEQVAGPLNEKQQKYLSTINESGHHLLALINDILDLAKIEAGQITLDINKVDVNSVCQASLRMIRQLAHKKNQEVSFEIDESLGLMWADERRLKQMIVNLLSNAVKFTPEGGRIGLEVLGEQAANRVTITVWDTGIGIKEQDLDRLFRPFVQLDSGLAREATGTGLGLALVAQMARMHGGSVHAISKPGEGSRFILQLPWEPVMGGDLAARLRNTGKFRAIDPNVERPTILLIEDTREVVMMLVDYLEMAGYKMVTAQDGIDGLAQARLTHPDLILMDIQMPRMDGFETTHKLRSDPQFKDIPIIALTALAMPNDRQRCLDAGMDEYMSKPVNLKTLTKTIQKLLSGEANTA